MLYDFFYMLRDVVKITLALLAWPVRGSPLGHRKMIRAFNEDISDRPREQASESSEIESEDRR